MSESRFRKMKKIAKTCIERSRSMKNNLDNLKNLVKSRFKTNIKY